MNKKKKRRGGRKKPFQVTMVVIDSWKIGDKGPLVAGNRVASNRKRGMTKKK